MKRQIIGIAAGGTGGHLIPAEVLAKKLYDKFDIVLLGDHVTGSPYLNDARVQKIDIKAVPLPKSLMSAFTFLFVTITSFWDARRELKKQRPQFLLGFGSYHTFPVLLAALSLKIPMGFFEANRVPGKMVRLFSKFACWVAIPYKEALKKIDTIQEEVAFPLRGEFFNVLPERKNEGLLTILVMGGSQGAAFLNGEVPLALAPYRERIGKVIHLFGVHGKEEEVLKHYQSAGIDAEVMKYSSEVNQLMKRADLAICRSGASTLAELEESGLPALLIPYPFERDAHQTENAKHFCNVKKGGWWLPQKEANRQKLQALIGKIISDDTMLAIAKAALRQRERGVPHLATLIEKTLLCFEEINQASSSQSNLQPEKIKELL